MTPKYIVDNINNVTPANAAQSYVLEQLRKMSHMVIEDDEKLSKLIPHIELILSDAKRENKRCKDMQVSRWTNPVDGDLNYSISTCGKNGGFVASVRVTKIKGILEPNNN